MDTFISFLLFHPAVGNEGMIKHGGPRAGQRSDWWVRHGRSLGTAALTGRDVFHKRCLSCIPLVERRSPTYIVGYEHLIPPEKIVEYAVLESEILESTILKIEAVPHDHTLMS